MLALNLPGKGLSGIRGVCFQEIDSALCNASWRFRFPDAYVKSLPRVNSDHHPIFVWLDPGVSPNVQRP